MHQQITSSVIGRVGSACALALSLGLSPSADAALTHYVPFDAGYTVGNNIGGSGGSDLGFGANTWFDGNTGNAIVAGDLASPVALASAGNHATTAEDFDLAFYTFDQNNNGSNGEAGLDNLLPGEHWLSFVAKSPETSDFGGFSFTKFFGGEILYIGKIGGQGSTAWGFDQGATGGISAAGSDSALETLLVVKLNIGAGANDDTADLYINPTPGAALPAVPDIAGYAFSEDPNDNRAIDEARLGSGNGGFSIDEIRIGQTFADVTPVPEPAAGALLLAGLGVITSRCSRRQTV